MYAVKDPVGDSAELATQSPLRTVGVSGSPRVAAAISTATAGCPKKAPYISTRAWSLAGQLAGVPFLFAKTRGPALQLASYPLQSCRNLRCKLLRSRSVDASIQEL